MTILIVITIMSYVEAPYFFFQIKNKLWPFVYKLLFLIRFQRRTQN